MVRSGAVLRAVFATTLALILTLLFGSSAMAARHRIIFDTDSAYFLDDGAALVMLLHRQDLVEIVGVTVVSGNLWARQGAVYMLHLLEVTGNAEIPLYIGAHRPLTNTAKRAREQAELHGALSYLGAFDQPEIESDSDIEPPFGGKLPSLRPQPQDAVSYLIETIEKNPGEITILALGPMTNVSKALDLRPDLAQQIRSLVFMGGALRVPGNVSADAEFNFWFDPEAAQQVLRSAIPEKVMFGLDITNRTPLSKRQFDEIVAAQTPVTEIMVEDDRRRSWGFAANPNSSSFIWDCLAAGYLLDPDFVISEESLKVDVHVSFGPSYGATFEPEDGGPEGLLPTRVMLDLDYPRFMALYKDLLTRWP